MLPKWREKPVLIWGASASAVLAWFLLYPAINDYRNRPIIHGENSNHKQVGLALGAYTQDYDETSVVRLPSSYSLPANVLAQRFSSMDGNSKSGAEGYQVDQSRIRIGGQAQTYAQRSDRRYIAPSQDLLEEGVQTNRNIPAHGTLKTETRVGTDAELWASSRAPEVLNRFSVGLVQAHVPASSGTLAYNVSNVTDDLPTERQVHKEASLTVEVANAETQSEAVERLVKESKGYVAQNQLTTVDDGTRQAALTCKVPVDQFDTVMGQLARLGLLKGKTLSGEDITDKVSDEQETGHVLRADIATTEEKLKERKRHSDAVRDEETLRQLRIRVAQSQARLKMLTKLGALSEITVELDEKPKNAAPEPTRPANPFMEEVSGTGQAAAHSFLMALRLPVQLLVWIVVYSPLWALLIYGYRRLTR
jgi:hypothetical protein